MNESDGKSMASDMQAAEKLHAEAAANYGAATARYEAACISGDADVELTRHYDAVTTEYAESLQTLVRARKAALPSFEAMLTDPALQLDPQARILASILEYAAAQPASAIAPAPAPELYVAETTLTRVREWALAGHGGSLTASHATSGQLRAAG